MSEGDEQATAPAVRRETVSAYLAKPDKYGFLAFNNTTLNTLTASDYDAILDDDARWEHLTRLMDADFEHKLEMFAYEEKTDSPPLEYVNWIERGSIRAGNFLKGFAKRARFSVTGLPRRYHSISRARIDQRFPGGHKRGDDIGDGDVRDMLSDLKIAIKDNMARLIALKRRRQLLYFLLYLAIVVAVVGLRAFAGPWAAGRLAGLGAPLGLLPVATAALAVGILFAAYGILFHFYWSGTEYAFQAYDNAQNTSCQTVDKQAALRTKSLANLVETFAARIDKDRTELMATQRTSDWPERSRRLVLLIYWIARRLEALEHYAQIEVWLIRRAHYHYTVVGRIMLALVAAASGFALALAAAAAVVLVLLRPGAVLDLLLDIGVSATALLLAAHFLHRVTRSSIREWNTSLNLIEVNLGVHNWDRFHTVGLHKLLGNHVFGDKQYIMQREEWVAGKNR